VIASIVNYYIFICNGSLNKVLYNFSLNSNCYPEESLTWTQF